MGLNKLDRGDQTFADIERDFYMGLEAIELFCSVNTNDDNAIGAELWCAMIYNNIGLLMAERGLYAKALTFYEKSINIKSKHHDGRGIAQTKANQIKCYWYLSDFETACTLTAELAVTMRRSLDSYICRDLLANFATYLNVKYRIDLNDNVGNYPCNSLLDLVRRQVEKDSGDGVPLNVLHEMDDINSILLHNAVNEDSDGLA